jgi:DNA-binding response OmpR family regulator
MMDSNTAVLLISQDTYPTQNLYSELKASGFRVTMATDGQAALQRLSREAIGLVLIEFVPPRRAMIGTGCAQMDSFQLLRQLRLNSQVPVIILSQESDDAVKLYFLHSGADDYVTMPCRCGELALRMRAVMRRAEHRTPV